MNCLITGTRGFVGKHLVPTLDQLGVKVIALSHGGVQGHPPQCLAVYQSHDVSEIGSIIDRHEISCVIHMASARVAVGVDVLTEVNVGSTARILQAIQQSKFKSKLILVSSSAVYGETPRDVWVTEEFPFAPINQYGATKAASDILATQFCHENGIPLVIARPFNLIGVGQAAEFFCAKVIRQAIDLQMGKIEKIRVGGIDTVRDFLDVRDFVRALGLMVQEGRPTGVFNLCSGVPTKLSKVLEFVESKIGKPVEVEISSNQIVLKSNVPFQVGSFEKMREEYGWQPHFDLRNSLEEMWNSSVNPIEEEGSSGH